MFEQELARKTSKRRKTQHTVQETLTTHHTRQGDDSNTHNVRKPKQDLPHDYQDPGNSQKHTKGRSALSKPYPMELTHPPPKPYKLRPQRVQGPNIRKRKTHFHSPHYENQH